MQYTVEECMAMPYHYIFVSAEEGGYVGWVLELPYVVSQGETLQECFSMVREAMAGWIEIELEDGCPIPLPITNSPV